MVHSTAAAPVLGFFLKRVVLWFLALEGEGLSSCLLSGGVSNFSLPASPTYTALLNFSIRNLRFAHPGIGKPVAVVLPGSKKDLRRAILCARKSSLAIRVRGGGHSYEGLSYSTENRVPFVLIDLMNLNRVRVDSGSATAWVQSGATLGELYYAIGQANRSLAFPAGTCSTVGVGGHVAGGGFGLLMRKFALAADNVLDAVLIDPNGIALTRASMDDDVFWAIRGGGGGSWGVVYAWRLRLVSVPRGVTVFTLDRIGPVKRIAELVYKWQHVGPNLPDEFHLSVYIPTGSSNGNLSMTFIGQVLGPKQLAMSVLSRTFPELGLARSDLSEASWLESTVRFAELDSVADLTDRRRLGTPGHWKNQSDYVRAPISMQGTIEIVRYISTGPPGLVQLDPYGGAMSRIDSSATPFPHRAGNLYSVQYGVTWNASDIDRTDEHLGWLRSFAACIAPYVSRNPRAAYVNFKDLDMGANGWTNPVGGSSNGSVDHARSWGERYFLSNFDRLVRAKTRIDPENVFNNAQSIPPLRYLWE